MDAEILATGDELRTGALVDSNSAYLAQQLESCGVAVNRHACVGDNLQQIRDVLLEISRRAACAVVTGGLGPTEDDLSAEAAALAAGVERRLDKTALADVTRFFESRGRRMSASNRKQALLPEGSERLDNPIGTAPGFMLRIGGCVFFFLPGVPREMKQMFCDQVLPRLEAMQAGRRCFLRVKTVSVFGLPESVLGEKLAGLAQRFPDITLGTRAKFPEIQVKLYARGEDDAGLTALLDAAGGWVCRRLGRHVFSSDGSPLPAVVGRLLLARRATLAVAESCTGGLISHWITEVAGSSAYFLFSGVTYADDAKVNLLAVSPKTLERYGAVHEETVREMAAGARLAGRATYALATSGIAGPGGGSDEKPVGTLCIGWATPGGAEGRRYFFPFGDRAMNKQMFAMAALDLVRRRLMEIGTADGD